MDIEKIIEKINWVELHKDFALHGYGMTVEIYEDGSHECMSSGSYTKNAVASLQTQGLEDFEETYSEGWATKITDTEDENYDKYIEDETGKIMTLSEMIAKCIEEGEWTETYEGWEKTIRSDIQDQMQYEEEVGA